MAKCICTRCKAEFKSVTGFDRHQVYDTPSGKVKGLGPVGDSHPQCLTTQEMISKGMMKNAHGLWIAEALDEKALARRRSKAG